jgi:hypothetical protein
MHGHPGTNSAHIAGLSQDVFSLELLNSLEGGHSSKDRSSCRQAQKHTQDNEL